MATYTNKDGTNSADTLTYNAKGTYHANGGNDTINITGGSGIVVYTDKGYNTINVTGGSSHTVKVNADNALSDQQNGVEKLNIDGANIIDAYLGAGKDEINIDNSDGKKITGALSAIHGGAWNDTFSVAGSTKNYQLYGDAGNDDFSFGSGVSAIVAWGGAGEDHFTIGNISDIGIILAKCTNLKLRGGDSADTFDIAADGVDIQLGYGNDVANIYGSNNVIKGNLGINTININKGSGNTIVADIDVALSKKNGFTDAQIAAGQGLGYGVDKLYLQEGTKNTTAHLGDGKDIVSIYRSRNNNIYTEGWGDTIEVIYANSNIVDAGDGEDIIDIRGSSSNNLIYGGNGADTIKTTDGYDMKLNLISGGAGKDHLEVIMGSSIISGDDGDDEITINTANFGSLNGNYIRGGNGVDTITVHNRENVVSGGNGADNITVYNRYHKVYGGADDDTIICLRDSDGDTRGCYISGGAGNDVIEVGECSRMTLDGGEGDDRIILDNHGGAYGNYVLAGKGNDFVGVDVDVTSHRQYRSYVDFAQNRGSTDKDTLNIANLDAASVKYCYDATNDILELGYKGGYSTDYMYVKGVSKLSKIAFGSSDAHKEGSTTYTGSSFLTFVKTGGQSYTTADLSKAITDFGDNGSVNAESLGTTLEAVQAGVKDEILKLTSSNRI